MPKAWSINRLVKKGGELFERDKKLIGSSTPHKVMPTIDKGSSQWPQFMEEAEVRKEVKTEADC